jgi:hypothetical protein
VGVVEEAEEFLKTRSGVEAMIMHIGLHTAQLVLIAEDGEWLRLVVPSVEQAHKLSERLNVKAHDGYPEHLRQRISAYRRSPEDWREAPYPERHGRSST